MSEMDITLLSVSSDDSLVFSQEELCALCHISPEFIQELVAYGLIEPSVVQRNQFESNYLTSIRRILRLQQDLELNLAGAVLVLHLLEQRDQMQNQVTLLKKHLG